MWIFPFEYTLIRSSRKTLAIQISPVWVLIVRSPKHLSISKIEEFLSMKQHWISKHQKNMSANQRDRKVLTKDELQWAKRELLAYLVARVSALHGLTSLPKYSAIKVTKSERRWGSCNSKNSLCFSYRLHDFRFTNPRFIDAIIYHELAHLKEKNHGKKFWNLVYELMPDYEKVVKNKI